MSNIDTMSVEQAADSLQCAVSKVYRLIHTNQLPATKVNQYWVIQKKGFIAFWTQELLNQAQSFLESKQPASAIQTLTLLLHHFPKSPEGNFEMGRAHFLNQSPKTALRFFHKCIKIKYDFYPSHLALGHIYANFKYFEKSLLHFSHARKLKTKEASISYNVGLVHQSMGDLGLAENAFSEALQKGFCSGKGHNALGYAHLLKKSYFQAIESFKLALKSQVKDPQYAVNLGYAYHQTHQYPLAIESYKLALEAKPCPAETYALLGESYSAMQAFPEALAAYQSHLKYYPYAAKTHYKIALIHLNQSQENLACPSFKKAIELNPQNLNAHFQLGKIYFHLGEYNMSLSLFQQALALSPKSKFQAKIRYQQALVYLAQKDFKNALIVSQKSLNLNPELSDVHSILAQASYALGLYSKVVKSCRQLLKKDSKNTQYLYCLGSAYYHQGQTKQAIDSFQKGLDQGPSTKILNAMGLVYQFQKQYLKAFKYYQLSLQENPNNNYASYNMGLSYMEQSQFQKAIKWYKKTLELAPEHPEVYLNLGFSYDNLGKLKQATKTYALALKNAPQNISLYFILGLAYSRNGNTEQAIETYELALKFADKEVSELYYYMGLAYLHHPKYAQKSIKAFQSAIKHSSKLCFENASYHLGKLHLQLGEADKAIVQFKTIVTHDLGASEAYLYLAQAYQLKDEKTRSLKYCRMALKAAPQDPEFLYQVGVIHFRFNMWVEALEIMNKALDINPHHAGSLNYLGSIYRKLNAPQKAVHYFKQALAEDNCYCQAYLNLSYLYFDLEDLRKALHYSQKAIACDSECANVYYWLGFLQYHSQNWEEAIVALDEALEIDSEHAKSIKLLPLAKKQLIREQNCKKPRFKIAGLF